MKVSIVTHPRFREVAQVKEAVDLINQRQDWFVLECKCADWVEDEGQAKGTTNPLKVLAAKEAAEGNKFTIIVTQRSIRGGYFADGDHQTILISTAAWETDFPTRPLYLYVASMIAGQLAFLGYEVPEEVEERQTERHEGATTGCINDYCELISDIWQNMLNAHICFDCEQELVQSGLAPEAASAIRKLLRNLSEVNASYNKTLKPDAFISYSTVDEQFATNLSSDLQKRGVKVWIGRFELLPGDSLFFKIGEGIAQSQVFIIVLSPRSVASRWCQMELANAIALEKERDGVFVIPALYESCEIPTLIKDKVYGDMRSDKYDASLARIVEMIKSSRRARQEAG